MRFRLYGGEESVMKGKWWLRRMEENFALLMLLSLMVFGIVFDWTAKQWRRFVGSKINRAIAWCVKTWRSLGFNERRDIILDLELTLNREHAARVRAEDSALQIYKVLLERNKQLREARGLEGELSAMGGRVEALQRRVRDYKTELSAECLVSQTLKMENGRLRDEAKKTPRGRKVMRDAMTDIMADMSPPRKRKRKPRKRPSRQSRDRVR
ncbi:MAG: hypothetical protein WCT11_04025 [Candidatus Magasanikbacteria bacterium]